MDFIWTEGLGIPHPPIPFTVEFDRFAPHRTELALRRYGRPSVGIPSIVAAAPLRFGCALSWFLNCPQATGPAGVPSTSPLQIPLRVVYVFTQGGRIGASLRPDWISPPSATTTFDQWSDSGCLSVSVDHRFLCLRFQSLYTHPSTLAVFLPQCPQTARHLRECVHGLLFGTHRAPRQHGRNPETLFLLVRGSQVSIFRIKTSRRYFEAEENPADAPIILTIGGGPGTSGMMNPLLGQSPCVATNDGLVGNPHAWTKKHNLIALDHVRGSELLPQ